jgi:hypothetical protein
MQIFQKELFPNFEIEVLADTLELLLDSEDLESFVCQVNFEYGDYATFHFVPKRMNGNNAGTGGDIEKLEMYVDEGRREYVFNSK